MAFVLDGASFLVMAGAALGLRIHPAGAAEAPEQSQRPAAGSFKATWEFIRERPRLRAIFILEVLTQLIILLQIPLTYVFVARYLGGPARMPQRTGLLFAAAGAGTCLGGLFLQRWRGNDRLLVLPKALLFDSLLVAGFALARCFPLNLFLYGLMGIIGAFMETILETAVQEQAPPERLGAVAGFIHSVVEPTGVVSLLLGGLISQWLAPDRIFILCAVVEMATGAYFLKRFRTMAGRSGPCAGHPTSN